jgi:hypothetical protein
MSTSNPNSNQQPVVRNTTKSFNIEGLTIYFDEFIIRDDNQNETNEASSSATSNPAESSYSDELTNTTTATTTTSASLNSTVDLDHSSNCSSSCNAVSSPPKDESPPFTFQLNPDLYLYTNPIICLTFSGMQTIKLTINNMRPSDLILEAAAGSKDAASSLPPNGSNANQLIQQQQRPLLELSAQFGSIKCLLCPRQIHLLIEMFTKLNDYMEEANRAKKALKLLVQKRRYLTRAKYGATDTKFSSLPYSVSFFFNFTRLG